MRLKTLITSIGLGAGLMYFYDPSRGNRRRAMLSDKVHSVRRRSDHAIDVAVRDMRNRARGFFADMMSMVSEEGSPDWLLEERVRARIGRNASHASAIEVRSEGGRVILSGPILADEVDRVVRRVASVRGVRGVENNMKVYQHSGDIPGLQGQTAKRMEKPEWAQENWSPTMRVLTGTGGALLTLYGMSRRGPVGLVAKVAGLGMAARGVANIDLLRFIGVSEQKDAVKIQKAININAPVEDLYRFWSNFENFPRFMEHIKEVNNLGGGRSRWKAAGPAGTEVEWEAMTTREIPNELIAWESVEGSQVKTSGFVRFNRNPRGDTRVTIHWNYTPPAGAIGHAVASLMGADPKKAMDDDLVRMKSLFEEGKTTVEGQEVKRGDISGTNPDMGTGTGTGM
jgi:uncharacterized membrane protein